jgi:hypothetical protein
MSQVGCCTGSHACIAGRIDSTMVTLEPTRVGNTALSPCLPDVSAAMKVSASWRQMSGPSCRCPQRLREYLGVNTRHSADHLAPPCAC